MWETFEKHGRFLLKSKTNIDFLTAVQVFVSEISKRERNEAETCESRLSGLRNSTKTQKNDYSFNVFHRFKPCKNVFTTIKEMSVVRENQKVETCFWVKRSLLQKENMKKLYIIHACYNYYPRQKINHVHEKNNQIHKSLIRAK